VEQAVCELVSSNPRIVSLEPNALADVWADIRRVATALGASERGEELVAGLQQRMMNIAGRARQLPEQPGVACVEWIDPLMAAGNWMPELVELAGGANLFGLAGKHSPWLSWEQLLAADPDVIVVLPCGYDLVKTRAEMPALTAKPEWSQLSAVQNRRVYLTDGNQFFNRPGPRLVESLEILAEILHPNVFHFGHEGTGWQHLYLSKPGASA
jgi:iron complex transport system substrate-binding protein